MTPLLGQDAYDLYKEKNVNLEKEEWRKLNSALGVKARELFLVHDLDGPKNNLMIWDEACFLFGEHLRKKVDMSSKYEAYTHPDNGCVVTIKGEKGSTGNGPGWVEMSAIEMEPFAKGKSPMTDALLDEVDKICPDDCVVEISPEKLRAMFRQTGGSSDDVEEVEEEDEETVATEEEEEPADEDDSEVEEEEEEEEVEEEEEEELDEDDSDVEPEEEVEEEEEEEPAPPPKKKPKPGSKPTASVVPPKKTNRDRR